MAGWTTVSRCRPSATRRAVYLGQPPTPHVAPDLAGDCGDRHRSGGRHPVRRKHSSGAGSRSRRPGSRASGIINAASPTPGVITTVLISEGDLISTGQAVAGGKAAGGADLVIVSPLPGTAWQQLAAAGAIVDTGTVVTQLLPPDSGTQLMLQVPKSTSRPRRDWPAGGT